MKRCTIVSLMGVIALSVSAASTATAQFIPWHHWGIGTGYFDDSCGAYAGFEFYDFQPAPIVYPPQVVIAGPLRMPAPIVRPPAVDVAVNRAAPNQRIDGARNFDKWDPAEEIIRRAQVLKPSTPAGRERADRLVSAGDTAFAGQIYARSTARYREAIARAPDYAEPHFRLAHAYIATRRYNLALTSALLAVELLGSSRRDGFSLEELYRGNKFARRTHDANLLDAAMREPEDGGLQFLLGLTFHYGGNPLKAREHFREAGRLEGPQQSYVRHFLPVAKVGEPEPLVAGAK